MHLSLQELIQILNEISIEYIKENQTEDRVPTYDEFEKYLIENFGINGRNQIVDQSKWLHYILSRS